MLNLGRHFDIPQAHWPLLCTRIDDVLSGQAPLVPDCPPAVEHEAQRIAAQLVARGAAGDGRPPDGQTCNGSMFTRCAWSAPVASGWSRWACGRWSKLGLPALLADLGVNGPFARRRPGPSSGAWPSRVQRQLLLPLGVSHICRFRSSWIEINNDDACGPCGRRLRRPKRGGKRAASSR